MGEYREFFFFQAEDGIRDVAVTGVQTCALPIFLLSPRRRPVRLGNTGNIASGPKFRWQDRKSTRLNSSHGYISYAVFCLKKKKRNAPSCSPKRKHHRLLPTMSGRLLSSLGSRTH